MDCTTNGLSLRCKNKTKFTLKWQDLKGFFMSTFKLTSKCHFVVKQNWTEKQFYLGSKGTIFYLFVDSKHTSLRKWPLCIHKMFKTQLRRTISIPQHTRTRMGFLMFSRTVLPVWQTNEEKVEIKGVYSLSVNVYITLLSCTSLKTWLREQLSLNTLIQINRNSIFSMRKNNTFMAKVSTYFL